MTDKTEKTGYQQMAAELTDLRTKVTPRTAQVMAALNMATGKERSLIARDVLDEWAAAQIHVGTMVYRLTRSEGTGVAAEGTPGNGGEEPV